MTSLSYNFDYVEVKSCIFEFDLDLSVWASELYACAWGKLENTLCFWVTFNWRKVDGQWIMEFPKVDLRFDVWHVIWSIIWTSFMIECLLGKCMKSQFWMSFFLLCSSWVADYFLYVVWLSTSRLKHSFLLRNAKENTIVCAYKEL